MGLHDTFINFKFISKNLQLAPILTESATLKERNITFDRGRHDLQNNAWFLLGDLTPDLN